MLTTEENELLTRVGPGTPAGEFFRRYWHPVGMLPELSDAAPTKHVRILGEDLVLFRTPSPSPLPRGGEGEGDPSFPLPPGGEGEGEGARVGLLADHCSHRGASLLYGRVEERGIACAYHGWLYDTDGNCLECPAEPADSRFHLTVKHRAYPVRERYGLYWAYLGPAPIPVLPRYDVAEAGPIRSIRELPRQDCNWLQVVENHLDQAHVVILHQGTAERGGAAGSNSTGGRIGELEDFGYREDPFGIRRRQVHKSGYDDTDLLIFPSTQRIYNLMTIKIPIDDTHTRRYSVVVDLKGNTAPERVSPGGSYGTPIGSNGTIEYSIDSVGKSPADAIHPYATYRMDQLLFQDFTMLETQGPIAAREHEHLATSDRGVVLLRTLLKREIEKVQQGLDPIGVIRDSDHDLVDTYIQTYMEMVRRFPPRVRGAT